MALAGRALQICALDLSVGSGLGLGVGSADLLDALLGCGKPPPAKAPSATCGEAAVDDAMREALAAMADEKIRRAARPSQQ